MNLADPELEYVDPTPNVHSLFVHFDNVFFWTKLAGKAVVRWSKRMYSCAGTCGYEGRGGICDIALSEPLLKLRPRKDLVETLLHEMIHAFLFLVGKDQSRDGHGPNFLAHMHRINQAAGLNISIYHDFHDEVRLYQNHVWRCNGPCQKIRPFFGLVKRTSNRAPGPSDFWWNRHKRACGGTFVKIQEPEIPVKPIKQPKPKKTVSKSNGDITKYINNNNDTIKNKNTAQPNKNNKTKDPNTSSFIKPVTKSPVFTGSGKIGGTIKPYSSSVTETVRNVWANKTLPTIGNAAFSSPKNSPSQINNKKRISDLTPSLTPPKKIKKIDDYFKSTATSILKDVYGKDFEITQSNDSNKLTATSKDTTVQCPICNTQVSTEQINSHIDECLNKDIIEVLGKETIPIFKPIQYIKIKSEITENKPSTSQDCVDLTMSNVPIKLETMISKGCVDLTTGYLQVQPGPSKESRSSIDSIDLKAVQIKIESGTKKNIMSESSTTKYIKSESGTGININSEIGTSKFIKSESGTSNNSQDIMAPTVRIKSECGTRESTTNDDVDFITANVQVKQESTSNTTENKTCPCCDKVMDKPVREHLDECLIFFDNDSTLPDEASTSFGERTIVIDDSDDEFDETQTLNATGTKTPCPCCMNMIEIADMNNHLDICLGL